MTQLANDDQLWTHIDLQEIARKHHVTPRHRRFRLRRLARHCPRLKQLCMNDSKGYEAEDILYFVHQCPEITELDLPFSPVSCSTWRCSSARQLRLLPCHHVPPLWLFDPNPAQCIRVEHVHAALASLALLKLNLEGNTSIDDELFDERLGTRFKTLLDLNMSHCTSISGKVCTLHLPLFGLPR